MGRELNLETEEVEPVKFTPGQQEAAQASVAETLRRKAEEAHRRV